MATVRVLKQEEMEEIRDEMIVNAVVNEAGYLILTQFDGTLINAGYVKGSSTPESVSAQPNYLAKRSATGQLKAEDPVDSDDLTTKDFVDAADSGLASLIHNRAPSGSIFMWPVATAPSGFLTCDGQEVSRATYSALFALIGTTYGVGNGTTTFNVPNFKGRVPVGLDTGQTEFDTMGEAGGAKGHTLTELEMPTHTHVQNPHTHVQNPHNHPNTGSTIVDAWMTITPATSNPASSGSLVRGSGSGTGTNNLGGSGHVHSVPSATAVNQDATATNQNAGGGGEHNNLQPYRVLTFIIKT